MVNLNIGQAFQNAIALHQAGRLAEAEALYRQILAAQPSHADALHLLGVIAHQVGRNDVAVELIEKAMGLVPNTPVFCYNLANALRNGGRTDEAAAAYRRAIQLNPAYAEAHKNLSAVLRDLGRLDEAVLVCRQLIQLRPDLAEAHNNLSVVLREQGCLEEATAEGRMAVQIRPDYAEAHNHLGNALRDLACAEEAEAAYRRAVQLNPNYAEAFSNLGAVLRDEGRLDDAIAACLQAIHLTGNFAEAHNNLATVLQEQGHRDQAIAAYRRALQINPDYAEAEYSEAALRLLRGDFEQGWPLFETRWKLRDMMRAKRAFPEPLWNGQPLNGRRVLIHAEQGLGDTLQFVRYASLVAQRGAQVIVECQPGLKALLTGLEGVSQIVTRGEPLPAFDLHCPMMSLPLAFGTRVETIPFTVPYLHAAAAKVTRWRGRVEHANSLSLGQVTPEHAILKVGLVWAGGLRPGQPNAHWVDRGRSLRLSQFAPLGKVPGVTFISLQKGAPAKQAQTPPEGMCLHDWTDELHDFADTAALIECLDLVISVDTAVAHLAGAMGKPVWLLNRFNTCWRWLLEREDSPWYPTMRLFRQPKFGDWTSVIQTLVHQLSTYVSESR